MAILELTAIFEIMVPFKVCFKMSETKLYVFTSSKLINNISKTGYYSAIFDNGDHLRVKLGFIKWSSLVSVISGSRLDCSQGSRFLFEYILRSLVIDK